MLIASMTKEIDDLFKEYFAGEQPLKKLAEPTAQTPASQPDTNP